MKTYSFGRLTWAIFLCLVSSTFVSVEIAKGNEHAEASHLEHIPEPDAAPAETPVESAAGQEDTAVVVEETEEPPATTHEPTEDPTEAETEAATQAATAPSFDASSVTTPLKEKIDALEKKVESLVSQLTSDLETKVTDLKDTVSQQSPSCPDAPSAPTNGNGNGKIQKYFDACIAALGSRSVEDAVQQWESIEKQTFGPTAKATLLKDILFLAYDDSKASVIQFVQRLLDSSKKFLPSVYDVFLESMKLNGDNVFALANTVKTELGTDASLYSKLPPTVREITLGKTVILSFLCKTLQKKLEVHVRNDEMTWEREYWPVVASNNYNLNHTKGALWTFETSKNGYFKVRNSWFGDYLWIEPNYQNLRTVDESTKNRNGTEFKLTLNSDDTVSIHSVFYKNAPVVEGYMSRSTRDAFRPLRVNADHEPIKFNVESTKTMK